MPSCSSVVGSLGVEVLGKLSSGRTVSCFYGKRVTDTANFYLYGKVLSDVVQWAQAAEVSLQPTLELETVS